MNLGPRLKHTAVYRRTAFDCNGHLLRCLIVTIVGILFWIYHSKLFH